jgi:phosphoribosylformylglycinamidine synthase
MHLRLPFEQILWKMTSVCFCRYCDSQQNVTEAYPSNPNGSPAGIAALCSPNGRHLAIMPHPERCFLMWQNPWYPTAAALQADGPSPWLKLFQNAQDWCASRS